MQDDQNRKEGVEMDIEREAPLHVLVPDPGLEQEGVGDVPKRGGDHQANPH